MRSNSSSRLVSKFLIILQSEEDKERRSVKVQIEFLSNRCRVSLLSSLLNLLSSLAYTLKVDLLLLFPLLELLETDDVNLVCHGDTLITKSDIDVQVQKQG